MENLVEIVNNQVVVSSRQIANNFDKEHKHVLDTIEKYIRAEKSALTDWFHKTTYKAGTGKNYPMYLMTKNGFSLVVMGFTTEKALQWKIRYINAFDQMERALRDQHVVIEHSSESRDALPLMPSVYAASDGWHEADDMWLCLSSNDELVEAVDYCRGTAKSIIGLLDVIPKHYWNSNRFKGHVETISYLTAMLDRRINDIRYMKFSTLSKKECFAMLQK